MLQKLLFLLCVSSMLAACGSSSSNDGGSANTAPPGNNPPNPSAGIDARPVNASCLAPARGTASTSVAVTEVFGPLDFIQPLAMLQPPAQDTRWFVLEKGGRVRAFDNAPGTSAFNADFIDLTSISAVNTASEGGLLGMAFHPGFATNGHVFLSWTEGSNPTVSVIARFTSLDGGLTLDPGSRSDVITVNQDFGNHNGGHLAFGPDGYLYFGLGDGGSADDPFDRAQDTSNLLGAMLRLDVDSAAPYAIPAGADGNPFAANAMCPADHSSATSCPEIYAWGLRNPWRWSFDRASGDLWLGDVGQGAFEEIDRIERGGNYGWDCREGLIGHSSAALSCPATTGLIDPVHVYDRSQGVSVTGGYVYRGAAIPSLIGSYVFGDFSSGMIWRLFDDGSGGFAVEPLAATNLSIASFAEDNDGELYVVSLSGTLHAIVPGAGGGSSAPVATLLSDTGCFSPQDPSQPVSGLIPYTVAAGFWSDGADKERWLALPDGTTIGVDAEGGFNFPAGSVLAKHFRLGNELIETRLLMRHPDGDWAGYTYEWNAAGTDAELVIGGKRASKAGQDWLYPSGGQCMNCHTSAAGYSLGLEIAQLNTEFTYAATRRTANQLETLAAIGMFTTEIGAPSALPALRDPLDATASLDDRARSYLHTNCAQCHQPGGPTPVSLDLRATTALINTGACNLEPTAGGLGIANALIIAPGEPARSVLLERMRRRDVNAMPPLASNLVDSAGEALLGAWIASLSASCQ